MKKDELTKEKMEELQLLSKEIAKRVNQRTNFITCFWNHHRLEKCLVDWKIITSCKYPNILFEDKVIKDLVILLKNLKREDKVREKREEKEARKNINKEKPYKGQSLDEIVKREEENTRLISDVLYDRNYISDVPNPNRKRK